MAGQGSCATGAAACIAVDHALAFVDGRLAPAERAAIEHRIDACAACRAVVTEAARRAGRVLVRGSDGRTGLQRALEVDATEPSPPLHVAATQRIVGERPRAARRAQAGGVSGAPPRAGHAERAAPSALAGGGDPDGVAGGAASLPRGIGAQSAPVDRGLVPGEVVGRYVVERPLGAGGMGVVSLARDPELRRAVVIKLVHPNMGFDEGDDELEARLRREAQAMAQLSHSNVVQIFDIGRRGNRVFLAMEFIAGHTLDGWLRARTRTTEEILGVFRQAGAGLSAAHRAGLVHRDVKPSNVLVGADGVVKVTDFGLARSFTGSPTGSAMDAPGITRQLRVPSAPRLSGVHAVLTDVNSVVGTPAYMAPEQAAGRAIDARTDQYALAVTLLDALLGQTGMRRAVPPNAPPAELDAALVRAGIAVPIRAAVIRALADDPAARFPAIDELLGALVLPAPAPAPSPRRRTGPILAGAAGLVLCGAAVVAWFVAGHTARSASSACTAAAPARWTGPPRARVIAALAAAPRPFAGWDAERIASAIDGAVDALGAAELARCNGAPLAGTNSTNAGAGATGTSGTNAGVNSTTGADANGTNAGINSTTGASATGTTAGINSTTGASSTGSNAGINSTNGTSAGTATCIEHRGAALDAAVAALSASPSPEDPWRLVQAIERCDPPANPASAEQRARLRGNRSAGPRDRRCRDSSRRRIARRRRVRGRGARRARGRRHRNRRGRAVRHEAGRRARGQ